MSETKVLWGICQKTPPNCLMQFVMGKVEITTEAFLLDAFAENRNIKLIEPVLIQRLLGLWQDPSTGKQQQVVTHQYVEDPYWPSHRESVLPFRLTDFSTVRLLNAESSKDVEEIKRYETYLTSAFAKTSGLVLPLQKR